MKTNAPNSRGSSIMRLLLRPFVFALLLVSVSSVSAQTSSTTDGSTPLGIATGAPEGSYALSGLDNVNLFNGALTFHVPVGAVVGRGNARYTMMLPVEQKWIVQTVFDEFSETNVIYPTSDWWSLKPGYGLGVLQGRQSGSQIITCSR